MQDNDTVKGNRDKAVALVPSAKQAADALRQKWRFAEAGVWTDNMLNALDNGVKGGKWFSLIDKISRPKTLELAWKRVKSNRGAAGIDGVSIAKFDANSEIYLSELSASLSSGSYQASGVRRVEIPKGNGKTRPLGIPTIKDRVAQMAVKLLLEPIFERDFSDVSYGFRPGLGCKDALRAVDAELKAGYTWVVDVDIRGYFDNIDHGRLMELVSERVSDGEVLRLLQLWLDAEIVTEVESWNPIKGTPQGAVISPLLANIYLSGLDAHMTELGYRMVRYADDFVILCSSKTEAEAAYEEVLSWLAKANLEANTEKSHVTDCSITAGGSFEFLGYRFERGRRWARNKSRNALRDKIRRLSRRKGGKSLKRVKEALNPLLRGWFNYFCHAYRTEFSSMDGFVRRRLRSLLLSQEKRPGFGKTLSAHKRWGNAFFDEQGLFIMSVAHAQLVQSRCGNL